MNFGYCFMIVFRPSFYLPTEPDEPVPNFLPTPSDANIDLLIRFNNAVDTRFLFFFPVVMVGWHYS